MPRDREMVIRDQRRFLRSLGPYLASAIEEKSVDDFFLRVFAVWFDRYPIGEFRVFDEDWNRSWAIQCEKKRIFRDLKWVKWAHKRGVLAAFSGGWQTEVTIEKMGRHFSTEDPDPVLSQLREQEKQEWRKNKRDTLAYLAWMEKTARNANPQA